MSPNQPILQTATPGTHSQIERRTVLLGLESDFPSAGFHWSTSHSNNFSLDGKDNYFSQMSINPLWLWLSSGLENNKHQREWHMFKNHCWGLVLWHSMLSCYLQCWHPIWAPVQVPTALLPIWLPENVPRKAEGDGPSPWVSIIQGRDLHGAPGSCFSPAWPLQLFGE